MSESAPAGDGAPGLEIWNRIALRWSDLDTLGHINQGIYQQLLAEPRMRLIERMGGGPFVLVRTELDFHHEVRHSDGHVDVMVRTTAVGRSSVTLDHAIRLPDGTVAASGRAVIVAWDPHERRSRVLSDREREVLGADVPS